MARSISCDGNSRIGSGTVGQADRQRAANAPTCRESIRTAPAEWNVGGARNTVATALLATPRHRRDTAFHHGNRLGALVRRIPDEKSPYGNDRGRSIPRYQFWHLR